MNKIVILLTALVLASCGNEAAKAEHENKLKTGLTDYLNTKASAIEAAFAVVANSQQTEEQFSLYIMDSIVPITMVENADGYELESILLSSDAEIDECRIYSPKAEVGAAIIPCANDVLQETLENGSYFNSSRELPRTGRPAMYMAKVIKLPDGHQFDNRKYVLLADWPRDLLDAAM